MPTTEFEPIISVSEQLQTHARPLGSALNLYRMKKITEIIIY